MSLLFATALVCPTLIVGLLTESCHHIFFSQTYHTLIFKNLTLDLKVNISWWNTCSADTNSSLNLFLQFARISTSVIFSSWLLRLLRSDKIFHLRYLETKVCWVKSSVEWTGCPVRQPVQLLVDQVTLYCEILYDVHSLLITCHQFFYQRFMFWFFSCFLLISSMWFMFTFFMFQCCVCLSYSSFGFMILTCMPPVSPSSPWLPRDVSGFYSDRWVTATSKATHQSESWIKKEKEQTWHNVY